MADGIVVNACCLHGVGMMHCRAGVTRSSDTFKRDVDISHSFHFFNVHLRVPLLVLAQSLRLRRHGTQHTRGHLPL